MNLGERLDGQYAAARSSREVIASDNYSAGKEMTVFVGIFNGAQYLDSLLTQISRQDFSACNLIVVDNHSTDESWAQLQSWVEKLPILLIRNHRNFGATGSLY